MLVNDRSLSDIFTAYSTLFQEGMGLATPVWPRIATPVPTSGTNIRIPWLRNVPGMREWIGDRHVFALESLSYEFPLLQFESTIRVPNREIEADQYEVYGSYMRMMGEAFSTFPDEKIWSVLANGLTTTCYDGQNFFSATHPVLDATGESASVSNYHAGGYTAWYLAVTKKSVKPLIWSVRKEKPLQQLTPYELAQRYEEIEYGCYRDAAAGPGFWQLILLSKLDLTADNYAAARAAIMAYHGDYGRKLGLVPDLLIVPPSLEGKARKICVNTLGSGGETNEWAGTAEVLVVPWL